MISACLALGVSCILVGAIRRNLLVFVFGLTLTSLTAFERAFQ